MTPEAARIAWARFKRTEFFTGFSVGIPDCHVPGTFDYNYRTSEDMEAWPKIAAFLRAWADAIEGRG